MEAGDFKGAVEFENKAIARMKPDSDEMKAAGTQLRLYENGRRFRETARLRSTRPQCHG